MTRILIAGGPKVGKTTLALELGRERNIPVRHTDDLIGACDWSSISTTVATWLEEPGPWIIEGVAVPRALRKWLATHPEGTPAETLFWRETTRVPRTAGQAAMAKGCATVWDEIHRELVTRGMALQTF